MEKNKSLIASAAALLAVSAISYKIYKSSISQPAASNLPTGYGLVTNDDLFGKTDDLVCTTGKVKIEGDIYVTYWKYEDPKCKN